MELLPCPFCGGKARLKRENNGLGNPYFYRIGCATFGCRCRYHIAPGEYTEDAAVKAWNTRDSKPRE